MTENPNNFDFTKYTNIQDHLLGTAVLHDHHFGELPYTYLGTCLEKDAQQIIFASNTTGKPSNTITFTAILAI